MTRESRIKWTKRAILLGIWNTTVFNKWRRTSHSNTQMTVTARLAQEAWQMPQHKLMNDLARLDSAELVHRQVLLRMCTLSYNIYALSEKWIDEGFITTAHTWAAKQDKTFIVSNFLFYLLQSANGIKKYHLSIFSLTLVNAVLSLLCFHHF